MAFKNIAAIMEMARQRKDPKTVAVAAAESDHVLEAVMRAKKDGFIEPTLVGDEAKIRAILNELGESIGNSKIIHSTDVKTSAYEAVQLVKHGAADFLMKGKLNTSDLLRAVLNKTDGLPHGKVVTQMTLVDLPAYHKVLVLNDAAIIPYPTLEQKVAQIQAVTGALHTMGYGDDIKIGIVCSAEDPNPKIPESADAVEIKRMNENGEITGCIIEGPISLDIALRAENAKAKGYESPVAGDADVLLFPNLVSGSVFIKSIQMFSGATPVGMTLGASAPISVSSRAATADMKYYSLALTSTAVR